MKKKTLNEMFEALNGFNPNLPNKTEPAINDLSEVMSQKLNPTAVKAFLIKAKQEFENIIRVKGEDVRKWAMDKVNTHQLFQLYEPKEKWGIASNLVLYVQGQPSPFDQFFPQIKEATTVMEQNDFFKTDNPDDIGDIEFFKLADAITAAVGQQSSSVTNDDVIDFLERVPLDNSVKTMSNDQLIQFLIDKFNTHNQNKAERSYERSTSDYYGGNSPQTDREQMDQAQRLK
jgi:hypothetical protein